MTPERRIRTLALAASEERWIRRGALLVEDALRTASLPWADAGRLLLVRAVDLGTIPAGAAPASISLALERRLRELEPLAVHAAHPDAPGAPAVWFGDAAEAHARLAAKLARGEEPAAWFWTLAVPAWRPGLPRNEALHALLRGALGTPAGPAAALELVQALEEAGGLDLLASALTLADGPWLLRACGWRIPDRAVRGVGEPAREAIAGRGKRTTAAFRGVSWIGAPVLARWAEVWGFGDARTHWLGAMLRALANPALLADPGLPERIAPARSESALRSGPRRAGSAAPPKLAHLSAPSPPMAPAERFVGAGLVPAPTSPSSIFDERGEKGRQRAPGEEGRPEARGGDPRGDWNDSDDPEVPGVRNDRDDPEVTGVRNSRDDQDRDDQDRQDRGSYRESQTRESQARESEPQGEISSLAGLFFLLPVFARLGLGGFLENHPHLFEIGFPARLLDHCARRFGAGEVEPARRAVPIPEEGPYPLLAFTAPTAWLQGIAAAPLRVRRQAGEPGVRLLTDASGRLDLALWHRRAGPGVRALLAGAAPGRGPASPARSAVAAALEAWLTASRRWCRRRAGIGLAGLVRRPGRVIATRTHVDVFLDPRQVEIRVRRAGLDQDPGWVPWLGRVVRFHYQQPVETLHDG